MKKIFSLLIFAAMILTTTAAFATAYREDVTEGADIASIKRIAIALPQHFKAEDTEPTLEEFTQSVFDASKVARCYVISYDEILANIRKDTGVDVKSLSDSEAEKTFKDTVSKYADAYLVVTTANNSKRTQFFFEVRNSQSGELVYVLTSQSSDWGKNAKDYKKACEDFYKKFDAAAEKNLKDQQKAEKKKNK